MGVNAKLRKEGCSELLFIRCRRKTARLQDCKVMSHPGAHPLPRTRSEPKVAGVEPQNKRKTARPQDRKVIGHPGAPPPPRTRATI